LKSHQPWERSEIISAIQAYRDGTKPEALAIAVGRTVSDARKKLASVSNFDPASQHGSRTPSNSLESEIWDELLVQQ
jgi:hypothetical protein